MRTEDYKPVCMFDHVIPVGERYYVVNPDGWNGKPEILCCEKCSLFVQPIIKQVKKRYLRAMLMHKSIYGENNVSQ